MAYAWHPNARPVAVWPRDDRWKAKRNRGRNRITQEKQPTGSGTEDPSFCHSTVNQSGLCPQGPRRSCSHGYALARYGSVRGEGGLQSDR